MMQRKKQSGFTLVELIIVMAIIAILISIAAPMYSQSVVRAREATLKQDLYHLRQSINQFTMDKQRAPQSLDELVSAGYLRSIPVDPFTKAADWEVVMEDVMNSIDQTQPGITDVRSTATGVSTEGTAYNSW
ncbi:MAG TPA: prepilin-type N-terminal cleavage/methylation domain-containing protein [Terriglobales bacterium]|nr:prepilin-type N-terminal cleavage/methylation domain-containing protein [Terriglobales bacterium]